MVNCHNVNNRWIRKPNESTRDTFFHLLGWFNHSPQPKSAYSRLTYKWSSEFVNWDRHIGEELTRDRWVKSADSCTQLVFIQWEASERRTLHEKSVRTKRPFTSPRNNVRWQVDRGCTHIHLGLCALCCGLWPFDPRVLSRVERLRFLTAIEIIEVNFNGRSV